MILVRFKTAAMAGLATILVSSVILSNSVGAVASGGIGGRPANPDPNNPRSQSIFIYTLDRGAHKTDEVQVANNGDTEKTINLYMVDGIVTNTGSFTCKQKAESSTSVGQWSKLQTQQVTLAPGEKQNVAFDINVPKNADVGEHNGCVVFQSAQDEGQVTGNVRVRTRQAVRVAVTVPGDLKREINIEDYKVSSESSKQIFAVNLKNNGNVSADVDTQVVVKSLFGQTTYQNGGEYPVLSGQKLDLSFTNEKMPFFGGLYLSKATIKYDKQAGTYGTENKENLESKSSPEKLLFVPPTPAGAVIITLALLLIAYLIYRTLKKNKSQVKKSTSRNHSKKR